MGIEAEGRLSETAWDLWNQWYALTAWLTAYEALDDEKSLECARRVGEWIMKNLPVRNEYSAFYTAAHNGGCAVDIIDQLVRLYTHTHDELLGNYIEAVIINYPPISCMETTGKTLVTTPYLYGDPEQYWHGNPSTDYMMHAYVLFAYLGGAVMYYAARRLTEKLGWVESVWDDLVAKHAYPTGGFGFRERLRVDAPNDGPDQEHQETCTTVEWMLLNRRLFEATGKSRYLEELESTIYNVLLAAQQEDGMQWCYYTTLRYWKHFSIGPTRCCFWSGPRGIAMLPELCFAKADGRLYVNLYEDCRAGFERNGARVGIEISGGYPRCFDVEIRVSVEKEAEFDLILRIPSWAKSYALIMDGQEVTAEKKEGYHHIRRTWEGESVISLSFEAVTRVIPMGNDKACVAFGPEVMSADSRECERTLFDTKQMDSIVLDGGVTLTPIVGSEKYDLFCLTDAHGKVITVMPYGEAGNQDAQYRTAFSCGE